MRIAIEIDCPGSATPERLGELRCSLGQHVTRWCDEQHLWPLGWRMIEIGGDVDVVIGAPGGLFSRPADTTAVSAAELTRQLERERMLHQSCQGVLWNTREELDSVRHRLQLVGEVAQRHDAALTALRSARAGALETLQAAERERVIEEPGVCAQHGYAMPCAICVRAAIPSRPYNTVCPEHGSILPCVLCG